MSRRITEPAEPRPAASPSLLPSLFQPHPRPPPDPSLLLWLPPLLLAPPHPSTRIHPPSLPRHHPLTLSRPRPRHPNRGHHRLRKMTIPQRGIPSRDGSPKAYRYRRTKLLPPPLLSRSKWSRNVYQGVNLSPSHRHQSGDLPFLLTRMSSRRHHCIRTVSLPFPAFHVSAIGSPSAHRCGLIVCFLVIIFFSFFSCLSPKSGFYLYGFTLYLRFLRHDTSDIRLQPSRRSLLSTFDRTSAPSCLFCPCLGLCSTRVFGKGLNGDPSCGYQHSLFFVPLFLSHVLATMLYVELQNRTTCLQTKLFRALSFSF